ncbi:hypothetical protein CEXT_679891 [Caerostris extrusa]|uniref:Uncharacterized protein n=1 Tax=Caerostris extrusa TaxID=172846 RepID=A0AAV4NXH1_CAEEX|nr:hypothetical protein CEXT_679891 [Caerostris extrusa]
MMQMSAQIMKGKIMTLLKVQKHFRGVRIPYLNYVLKNIEIHKESSTELSDEKEDEVGKLRNFENVDIQSDLYLSDDENECTDNEGQNNDFVKDAETLQRSSNSLPELCSKICNVTPNFKNKSNVFGVEIFHSEIQNKSLTESNEQNPCSQNKLHIEENDFVLNASEIIDPLPNLSMTALEKSTNSNDLYLSDDEKVCTEIDVQNKDSFKSKEFLEMKFKDSSIGIRNSLHDSVKKIKDCLH